MRTLLIMLVLMLGRMDTAGYLCVIVTEGGGRWEGKEIVSPSLSSVMPRSG